MKVKFINVKPGNYKFIILENDNVNMQTFEVLIQPYLRKKD